MEHTTINIPRKGTIGYTVQVHKSHYIGVLGHIEAHIYSADDLREIADTMDAIDWEHPPEYKPSDPKAKPVTPAPEAEGECEHISRESRCALLPPIAEHMGHQFCLVLGRGQSHQDDCPIRALAREKAEAEDGECRLARRKDEVEQARDELERRVNHMEDLNEKQDGFLQDAMAAARHEQRCAYEANVELSRYKTEPEELPDGPETMERFEDWACYREGQGLKGWAQDLRRWGIDKMALETAEAELEKHALRTASARGKAKKEHRRARRLGAVISALQDKLQARREEVQHWVGLRDRQYERAEAAEGHLAALNAVPVTTLEQVRGWFRERTDCPDCQDAMAHVKGFLLSVGVDEAEIEWPPSAPAEEDPDAQASD